MRRSGEGPAPRDRIGTWVSLSPSPGRPAFDPGSQGWPKTEYRRGDILDRPAVEALVRDADVVVHLAFVIMGSREQSRRVNIAGARNVFEAVVAAPRTVAGGRPGSTTWPGTGRSHSARSPQPWAGAGSGFPTPQPSRPPICWPAFPGCRGRPSGYMSRGLPWSWTRPRQSGNSVGARSTPAPRPCPRWPRWSGTEWFRPHRVVAQRSGPPGPGPTSSGRAQPRSRDRSRYCSRSAARPSPESRRPPAGRGRS